MLDENDMLEEQPEETTAKQRVAAAKKMVREENANAPSQDEVFAMNNLSEFAPKDDDAETGAEE